MENQVVIKLNDYNNMRDELKIKREIVNDIDKAITKYSKDSKGRLEPLHFFELPKAIKIDLDKLVKALGFNENVEIIIEEESTKDDNKKMES